MIFFVSKKKEKDIEGRGYQKAINDLLLIRDKIYLETVNLVGDNHIISNCAFLIPKNSTGIVVSKEVNNIVTKDSIFVGGNKD